MVNVVWNISEGVIVGLPPPPPPPPPEVKFPCLILDGSTQHYNVGGCDFACHKLKPYTVQGFHASKSHNVISSISNLLLLLLLLMVVRGFVHQENEWSRLTNYIRGYYTESSAHTLSSNSPIKE